MKIFTHFVIFGYTFLKNVLTESYFVTICNEKLYKWNFSTSDACLFYNLKDSTKHQLFECNRVSNVWHRVSNILKTIILGFKSDNLIGRTRKLPISIFVCAIKIYKKKLKKKSTINSVFVKGFMLRSLKLLMNVDMDFNSIVKYMKCKQKIQLIIKIRCLLYDHYSLYILSLNKP